MDQRDLQKLNNAILSGEAEGRIAGVAAGQAPQNSSQEQEKKKEKQGVEDYIRLQLVLLDSNIAEMESLMAEYAEKMQALGVQIEMNTATIGVFKDVIDLQGEYSQYDTYADLLKDKYGDKVFTDEPGNAWEVLQNPLRDSDGNLVYSNSEGQLYRLETNAETGELSRIIYDDPHEVAELMAQAFDPENPVPFAEYTALGRDPENFRMHEWIGADMDLPPEIKEQLKDYAEPDDSMNPLDGKAMTIGSANMADFRKVCDQYSCMLIEQNVELEQELSTVQEKYEQTEEELQDTKERRGELGGTPEPNGPDPIMDRIGEYAVEIAGIASLYGGDVIYDQDILRVAEEFSIPPSHLEQLKTAMAEIEPALKFEQKDVQPEPATSSPSVTNTLLTPGM